MVANPLTPPYLGGYEDFIAKMSKSKEVKHIRKNQAKEDLHNMFRGGIVWLIYLT